MVHSRGRDDRGDGHRRRVLGTRTAWRVTGDGEFFCPRCGGDRCYQELTGRRRFAVLGVSVLPRGAADPVVACAACRGHFPPSAVTVPTTMRLAGMLRDAVHAVALAVLAAGGAEDRGTRRTAVEVIHEAGYPDCTEERLLTLLAVVSAEGPRGADTELGQALDPLAPLLAVPGRESLLLRGARIALADGPYLAAESTVLAGIGRRLDLAPADTARLLTAARTPS
ncbi:zinc ribbon domain-containing protein [Streptomyces sp. ST2-7A]|uniref:zinc ribbon domain-containing protein n=1 Tax=Streptomyces sp. ST2-7A TaxID=2907214 RepID=UPI001F2B46DC|nr:zinc ribbon domain-containing protein [Streptomyces sp. ST2-7A]MCE7079161.1 zinc ribbon domain-containing protein [Streptomyces sp. ST2-7A]